MTHAGELATMNLPTPDRHAEEHRADRHEQVHQQEIRRSNGNYWKPAWWSQAELLIRNSDGTRPAEPEIIGPDGSVTLASIDFAAPLAAFYRTTALAASG